ncbi:hypothetical protein KCU61_g457, partial [Aureobasidium melanogenum]
MYSVDARGNVRLCATGGRFLLDGLELRSLDLIGRLCKLYVLQSTRKGLFVNNKLNILMVQAIKDGELVSFIGVASIDMN